MKTSKFLSHFLAGAPCAECFHYDAGDTVVCRAKGMARNSFPLACAVSAVALETDGDPHRFPPDKTKAACDWCIFTECGFRGCFIELKGSNYLHALDQLASTMTYMHTEYGIDPRLAFVVLSGVHPSNARPGKANAKTRFAKRFPGVVLRERSSGKAKPEDVLR